MVILAIGFVIIQRQKLSVLIDVIGIDRLENRLNNAKQVATRYNLKTKFYHINIENKNLDFPKKTFTKIFLIDVLEHLRKPRTLINKCSQWLKPGGILIITTPSLPQKRWVFKNKHDYFSYGHDHHFHQGFSLKLIKNWINYSGCWSKVAHKDIFFAIYQFTWEFSEKIRKISPNLYRLLIPFLHPLLVFDRFLHFQQNNAFILIAKK